MKNGDSDFIDYEYIADGLQLNILCGKAPKLPEQEVTETKNDFHTHFWYELFFAKNQAITFHLKEKNITVPSGHFLLVKPGHIHYVTNPECTPVFSFYVTAKNEKYSNHPILETLECSGSRIFRSDTSCDMLFTLLTNAFLRENAREAGNYMFGFLLHISDLELISDEITTPDSDISRIFKIDLLINNYVERNHLPDLKDLAEELNISTRQLSRIFKNKYGCSFTEKLPELRMRKAAQLLRSGKTVTTAAEQTGYSSGRGFYAAFYSIYGVTPGDYRKKYTNVKHPS